MKRKPESPLHLTLRQLQIFVAVAEAGSTLAAGARIGLSQPATSAALNELEALLGGRLFNRAGRRLVLNEHGRSMLPQARALLDAATGLEQQFGPEGRAVAPRLKLAASITIGNYVLPKVLAAWHREEPGARSTVEIANTPHVARAVASFEVDVGFIEGPTTEAHVEVEPWTRDELLVLAAPGHPLALASARRRLGIAALREATWVLREPGSGTREVVERALLPKLHRLRTDTDLASAEAIKHAVAEGMGITVLSRHAVADFLALGRLVVLDTALPPLARTFYMIHPAGRRRSPTLGRFLAVCRATYPAHE